MKVQSYKELEVWVLGIEIVDLTYRMMDDYPAREMYCLANQMRKTAISIPSNIAEGNARQHKGEYRQFCSVARRSCAELETQLIISVRRGYPLEKESELLSEYLDRGSRMLHNLISRLS